METVLYFYIIMVDGEEYFFKGNEKLARDKFEELYSIDKSSISQFYSKEWTRESDKDDWMGGCVEIFFQSYNS